jgi:polysaccharide export outer membrane protein
MKKSLFTFLFLLCALLAAAGAAPGADYRIGVSDILEVSVLAPDEMIRAVNVAPDGTIALPYIGSVRVKGLTVDEARELIRARLADGYLRHPVVLVSLQESRSQNYLVYGEVINPGSYPLGENTTVLSAISIAGGFSKYGSSSRVRLMRPRQDGGGYENIPVNLRDIMRTDRDQDIPLNAGDIVVVSEGVF